MNNKLKLVIAGLMVAVALVTTNLSVGTPSASAQSPYCALNPTVCTVTYCQTYPQICGSVINPIYPVYPVYPIVNYPCGYVAQNAGVHSDGLRPQYGDCADADGVPIERLVVTRATATIRPAITSFNLLFIQPP